MPGYSPALRNNDSSKPLEPFSYKCDQTQSRRDDRTEGDSEIAIMTIPLSPKTAPHLFAHFGQVCAHSGEHLAIPLRNLF